MNSNRKMTSWERRRRRRHKITLVVSLLLIAAGSAAVVGYSRLPYGTLNLKRLVDVEYGGYETKGNVIITLNNEELEEFFDTVKAEYRGAIIKWESPTEDDYTDFAESIEISCDRTDNLSNGDNLTISFDYDEDLAASLNISVNSSDYVLSVAGLEEPTYLTSDDLFKDVSVEFSGVSPNITMEVKNNSSNPFIQNIVFSPEEYKEFYKSGDVVRLRAFYSDSECIDKHYAVDVPSEECIREYTVGGLDTYVVDENDISGAILNEAIEAGKRAFNNANEYGVRIFCEANLVPVYINKQATFEWLTPSLISAYFKVAHDGVGGVNGNHYNDLDLIYKCQITQADGVTCSAEGVVRFSDFVKRADGTVEYDFSGPKLISASYNNSSIVKTVKGAYEETYNIIKLK